MHAVHPLSALFAAALCAPALAFIAPRPLGPLAATALWGLALAISFGGWGGWLGRRLAPRQETDWGLRAGWGLALTVAVGGALCLLGLARRPVLIVWAFGGIALSAAEVARTPPPDGLWRVVRRWETPFLLGLGALGGLLYLGSAGFGVPNPSDDWIAYLPFAKMIQQTGTLLDPFNVRRMAAYGGQSYLQALTRLCASEAQIQSFDQGMGLLLSTALVWGAIRRAAPRARLIGLLTIAVVLTLPEIRQNSASELSGVVAFLILYRTIEFADARIFTDAQAEWRGALLVALPAAAACTLRQNYIAVVGIMLLALAVRGPDDLRARLRRFGQVAALTGAALFPWMALSFRSNHTFLFPIFAGYYDRTYAGITAPATWGARFALYREAMFRPEPVSTMPFLLLAAPLLMRGGQRRALLGLWAGTIVGFALVSLSLPDVGAYTIVRYSFAFVVACALAIALAAAERLATAPSRRDFIVVGVTVAALLLQLHGALDATYRNVGVARERLSGRDPNITPLGAEADVVARLQQAVPAGERLLVMIERPYLLDYARNSITHLDQPGACSPPPGIPLAAGGEPVAAYLLANRIRYFAFVRPDKARDQIYNRAHWQRLLTGKLRVWRITAPSYLATFTTVDELAATRRKLYDDGHLVAVDLAARE